MLEERRKQNSDDELSRNGTDIRLQVPIIVNYEINYYELLVEPELK